MSAAKTSSGTQATRTQANSSAAGPQPAGQSLKATREKPTSQPTETVTTTEEA